MQIFLTSEMCSLIGRGKVLCKNGRLGGGGGQGFLIKGAEWGGGGKEQTRSCISLWGKEWGVQEIREWVGDVSIKGKGGKETHLDNVGSTKACYYVCSFGDKGTRNTCTGESFRCQGLFVLKAYMSNFKGFFCLK